MRSSNFVLSLAVLFLPTCTAWAICFSSGALDVWPPSDEELAPNGCIIITAETWPGVMADVLRRCPPVLVGFQERVALQVIRVEHPYRAGARAVLRPMRWLRPEAEYELEFHGFTAEHPQELDLKTGWPLPGRDAPRWRTARTPDWTPPRWRGAPVVEKVSSVQYGCGSAVNLIVKTPIEDDRPGVAILATVQPLVTWECGQPAFDVELLDPRWMSWFAWEVAPTVRRRPYGDEAWWRPIQVDLPITGPPVSRESMHAWIEADAARLDLVCRWDLRSQQLPAITPPVTGHASNWFFALAAPRSHERIPGPDRADEYLERALVPVEDGRADLGHAMCGGAFGLVPGRRYRVWFDAVDRAGNHTPASKSLEIVWPVNDSDRMQAMERSLPPDLDAY